MDFVIARIQTSRKEDVRYAGENLILKGRWKMAVMKGRKAMIRRIIENRKMKEQGKDEEKKMDSPQEIAEKEKILREAGLI